MKLLRRVQRGCGPSRERDVSFPADSAGAPDIDKLEKHVLEYAISMQTWYKKNKARKRTLSKCVRFIAIISLVTGGLYPVIAHLTNTNAYLGYVILGSAGGLYILDRMFDISASWMRDIAAMQAIDKALYAYQVERIRIDTSRDDEIQLHFEHRLNVIESLAQNIFDAVKSETTEWRSAFENAIVDLEKLVKPEERISAKPRETNGESEISKA